MRTLRLFSRKLRWLLWLTAASAVLLLVFAALLVWKQQWVRAGVALVSFVLMCVSWWRLRRAVQDWRKQNEIHPTR